MPPKTAPRAEQADPILRRLRQERLDRELSLAAFTRISGLKEVVIGSYERGDRAVTLARLQVWAAHFGLEVVLRPVDADGQDAYRRGFEAAVTKVCAALGIRVDADGGPLGLDIDWDDELNDGYEEPPAPEAAV